MQLTRAMGTGSEGRLALSGKKMVDDLLKRYDWEGMPRAEVESLLGKPQSGIVLIMCTRCIKKKIGFFGRLHTLVVKFREDGVVKRW